jgi:hypothetical protein
MLVIRTDKRYDYVDDFMLENLIKSKEIIKFKRNTEWVSIGTAPAPAGESTQNSAFNADRLAINDSIFVREYRKANHLSL